MSRSIQMDTPSKWATSSKPSVSAKKQKGCRKTALFIWWPGALSKKQLQAAPVLGFSYFLKFWVQVRVQPLNRCFLTIFGLEPLTNSSRMSLSRQLFSTSSYAALPITSASSGASCETTFNAFTTARHIRNRCFHGLGFGDQAPQVGMEQPISFVFRQVIPQFG
jgi:hypothetical protein